MKNILFVLFYTALSVSFAFAQGEKGNVKPPDLVETKRAEMKKLDRMIGKWQGSGWIQQGKQTENFAGTENVQRKIDGLALLIEGNFKNKEGAVIHDTLAVLSPNLQTKNYDFQTYLANGRSGTYELKAAENGWQWGLQFPGNMIRYNIKIENNVWNEIGEMSQDEGKTWLKIFEMNLKKIE